MEDPQKYSGLPISWDENKKELNLGQGVSCGQKTARTLDEMKAFAGENITADKSIIYYVYREIAKQEDAAKIQDAGLRYDITILEPGTFAPLERRQLLSEAKTDVAKGVIMPPAADRKTPVLTGFARGKEKEYFRTAGHYHPQKPGTQIAYPEVFEVLSGRAYWLLQKSNPKDFQQIEEAYLAEAGPGEHAIMLPNFGHILINAQNEPLITANWIGNNFTYDYQPFKTLQGGAYLLLEGLNKNMIIEKNPHYGEVPEIKKLVPREVQEFGMQKDKPMYALAQNLGKLDFLINPEKYQEILTLEHCFRAVN